MNRILQLILILVSFLSSAAFNAHAENDKGTWKIHTVFNENKKKVIDTADKVYCLTDDFINVYNKITGKWESLTKLNRLSDFYVNNIYYNSEKGYLVVTYNNYNIDILLADGRTINIPNIKDMTSIADMTINDVTFAEGKIYVASKVGFLVIDDKDFKVVKSALLNASVESIAEVGDKILVTNGSDVLFCNKNANIKSLSQFTSAGLGVSGTILPISETQFFLKSNLLYIVTIDSNGINKKAVSQGKPVEVQATANGYIAIDNSKFYLFGNNCDKIEMSLPSDLAGTLVSSQEKDNSIWRLSSKGLKHVKLDFTASTASSISEELIPNAVTAKRVAFITYNKHNKKLYVSNGGPGNTYLINDYSMNAHISSFDGNNWKNEIPADMKGNKFQDPYEPTFDPNDPETFYVGTWFQGVYKIKNGELIAKYDWNNSPFTFALNWYCQILFTEFDKEGNLWTIQSSSASRTQEFSILKKEYLNKSDLSATDWYVPLINTNLPRSSKFFITRNNYKFLFDGQYLGKLKVFTNDEQFKIVKEKDFSNFIDKENKKVKWNLILDFKEDLNDTIWMAYNGGIVAFNPNDIFKEDFKVRKPKNANNKYTLDNVFSTCISVDDYNRKWIGTVDDGFYLLNEDCTEVLQHFNTYNSCIPNNKVLSIEWNPKTQSVFVGFCGGLIEYKPEEYLAKQNIVAQPNVVSPDYKEYVKFLNVPENSVLTIKDSDGKVIRTIKPVGSEYYWDCTHENGSRVGTGEYIVTATVDEVEKEDKTRIYVIK